MNKSKNRFTLKIIFSYFILAILTLVVAYFMVSEIRVYVSTETNSENDTKLLKTGSLLTELYQAESLSKLALQKGTPKSFTLYTQKIDSIFIAIDSLKLLSDNPHQKKLLDSVQGLLKKKVFNSNELLRLKRKSENNNSFDDAILEFSRIEQSLGKITPESLNPNYLDLTPEAQSTIRKWAEYLSENVPKDSGNRAKAMEVDSVITASKSLLQEAKQQKTQALRSLAQKEMELGRADLEISHQLRNIISAIEQEIIVKSYNDSLKKQEALKRSIKFAGFATLLGFGIAGLFTFLITRDYWKVQLYRQQLEKEKKFSESLLKSREQLISTVSHDLRTPLNTITGYAELMETTGLTGKQVSYLKNIRSASHYVDNLVNDLLDYSRLEAGKIKIEKSPFILADLITETAVNIKALNSQKKIALQLDIDGRLHKPVSGDAFRVRQILNNLIGNAYKFTEKGFIRITAKINHETDNTYKTEIQITDSGIGIKKEKQEQIFKEFTQAEDHTDKKYGGYGLGLTISKKLTELLNGKIGLRSEAGKGSTFSLKIPFEISKVPMPIDPKTEILPPTKISLLIVDDDPAMLKLLKEVCLHLGLSSYTYNNFYEIGKSAELDYDMVLTDIQMPNISGFEVLEKLKGGTYSHYKGQPIVAMTGRKDLEKTAYLGAGFADILQKPFTKDLFTKVLGELFPAQAPHIPKINGQKKIISDSNLFSLEVISSFLGDDRDGIAEVLHTFVTDTTTSLDRLKNAVNNGEIPEINSISHKMLPMFRQLRAHEVIPILERLEILKTPDLNARQLQQHYSDLKNGSTILILAINAYLAKDLNYSG